MFCKTTRSKISIKDMDKLTGWVQDKWGPLISRQEGFKGYYFVSKPDGDFIIIMLWEEESLIQSWSDNPKHKELVPEFMSLMIGPVEMDVYKIEQRKIL